ncbi:MAG: NAD(P)H-binding protein, partial [Pseudomonadales bacterium]
MQLVITGANGHLGRRLIARLSDDVVVRAVVRSESAKAALVSEFGSDLDIHIVDYQDAQALERAITGYDVAVHLVGIIKEGRTNTFEAAHVDASQALVVAARQTGLSHIVYLSLVGSSESSSNPCFASRGRAERILLDGAPTVTLIRVPMVLGEGDYAAAALGRQAASRIVFTFRASSLEQPIYAGDVIEALVNSLTAESTRCLTLAGPESLTRRALIARASGALQVPPPMVVSLPLTLGMWVARLLERLPAPPVTRAMLGVLDHDDAVDGEPGADALGIELTP